MTWLGDELSLERLPSGNFVAINHVTNEERFLTPPEAATLIRQHAQSKRHVPLGDYVHGAFSRLGIGGDCVPCAKRQRALNAVLPRGLLGGRKAG
jgi:hypothetical protein